MTSRVLQLAAHIGAWWHAVPALIVVLAGLATCHLVEIPDPDSFNVERSLVDGTRAAVVVRHAHADSGKIVRCIWLVAAPPPAEGLTKRLAPGCVLVATDADAELRMRWGAGGKLDVGLPAGSEAIATEPPHTRCYFETEKASRRVCFMPQSIRIETR